MLSNPAVHTPPLSDDFPSLWDRYAKVIQIVWRVTFNIQIDDWQIELLRHVLELYPAGHPRAGELRFRQVIISLPRQVGKTEIAAIIGLLGLLRLANTLVIGIASSREQAALIYKRTLYAIEANRSLRKRFKRVTDTRGIQGVDGSLYELKAAKGAALQGLPVMTGVVDEVHLLKPELWNALVSGLGGRANGLVVGITTAGDDNSELLKDLYKTAHAAAEGDETLERFGAFIWQAPESRVPDDDAELLAYLREANPALACGRLDPELVLADMRAKPDADVIRYHLNRFIESVSAFIPLSLWGTGQRSVDDTFPKDQRPVISIDRSPDWRFATFTASVKRDNGDVYTEVISSFNNPSPEELLAEAVRLKKFNPYQYVADGYTLKPLVAELKKKNYPVFTMTLGDQMSAAARFHALLKQGKVKHKGDLLLTYQLPNTVRKNVNDNFKIARKDMTSVIDSVMSTVAGVYVADTVKPVRGLQLF